jgi:hypothetical protein
MEEALRYIKIKARKYNYSIGEDVENFSEAMIYLSDDLQELCIINRKKFE